MACTLMLAGLHQEAREILGLGDFNEDKKKALLSLIAKRSESSPPEFTNNEDLPICKAYKAGKALNVNQHEILHNCL
ncbi:MAG: hypothetical protein ACK5V3_09765 [Bdellovibrionales bacterium]